MPPDSDDAIEV